MKKKLIYSSLIALILAGGTGCKKFSDFGDTNVNPAATTQANVAALLTNSLAGISGYAFQLTPGQYCQYFSQSQYPDVMNYSLVQASFAGEYSGTLYDLQNIQIENKSNNQNQVAKIIQQYIFWRITDRWGDVPYSQALKGVSFTKPVYDKQEDIYKGMLTALTAAAGAFDGSAISGDIVFNGDAASWKRVANSLRLVIAIQMSKRYPGASEYAATEFKAALADAGGVITANSQNFQVNFPGGNYKNTVWGTYNGRKDYGESLTMTNLTGSLGDARQDVFGGASEQAGNVTTSSVGIPYGKDKPTTEGFTNNNTTWARILRGDKRTDNSPMYILTASHVALARAEAANLGWTTDNLATMYVNGITLSHEQWGVAAPSAGYLAGVAVGGIGAAGNVEKISTQRYLAYYPDGLSGWNVWRKTGFPALTPATAATNTAEGGVIPRRYAYATSEQQTNKANNTAAVARIPGGQDLQSAKMWWDQ
jgi:hypothetical protein